MTADNFEATGLGPLTTPGTDDVYVGGYGLMGSRASPVYISNVVGPVCLNHAGVHGVAATALSTQLYNTTGNTSSVNIEDHAGTSRDVGFNHVREYGMTTGSFSLDDQHCGCIIRRTGSSVVTLTVAISTGFPVGSMCTVLNHGTAGSLTISDSTAAMYIMDGSGTPVNSGGFALGIGGCLTIWRQATLVYYVWGAGIP